MCRICTNSIVAGVMTFLVFYELLPLSIKFCGPERATTAVFTGKIIYILQNNFAGMGLCFLSLVFLRKYEIPEFS
jgi:hypothetical protein